ncbi:MAG: hypothetical protein IJK51_08610 [Bacteroidaceae bacterium]|nr:hypothetical protein [Bacteroidaceae bacterium]
MEEMEEMGEMGEKGMMGMMGMIGEDAFVLYWVLLCFIIPYYIYRGAKRWCQGIDKRYYRNFGLMIVVFACHMLREKMI